MKITIANDLSKGRFFVCLFLAALLIQPWFLLASVEAAVPINNSGALSKDAAEAADILEVRNQAEQLASYNRNGTVDRGDLPAVNKLRAAVLRKIFLAVTQVRSAENKLENELAYTYKLLSNDREHVNFVNDMFTIMNFMQFSVLYTIEPYSRIHKQFKQSGICTSVGSGLGASISILNVLYNRFHKVGNLKPPSFLSHLVNGSPVGISEFPPLVKRYMDYRSGGAASHYEDMNAQWGKRYNADVTKKETLAGIDDGKSKKQFELNRRIVLLWSLTTHIQYFDRQLLALLKETKSPEFGSSTRISSTPLSTPLPPKAAAAARILKVEGLIAELQNGSADGDRRMDLQLSLLENILGGSMELRDAADKVQGELNYQNDVVLAGLLGRRGKTLQKLFELNFIQANTMGATAGWCYLNYRSKAGNQLFAIANSVGLLINTLSLLATHGGFKKIDQGPNSLADFFNLQSEGSHGFTPMVWDFLNSPDTERGAGKTRRQYLQDIWKQHKVVNVNIDNDNMKARLASMPSAKWDSIKLVVNRITLLSSLGAKLEEFDGELLSLLRAGWTAETTSVSGRIVDGLNSYAQQGAEVVGVTGLVSAALSGDEFAKLQITRNLLEAFLEVNANNAVISRSIVIETQALQRMQRQRDKIVALTNIGNFYQIGILGIISDSLGLCKNEDLVLAGDRINIISGIIVGCAASTAFLEKQLLGLRFSKTDANSLGEALGVPTDQSVKLSPMLVRYLDTAPPSEELPPDHPATMTRRQCLIKYWDQKVKKNPTKQSTAEKLTAFGNHHHWWDERIKMVGKRVAMLYDLRATLGTTNKDFSALLNALN